MRPAARRVLALSIATAAGLAGLTRSARAADTPGAAPAKPPAAAPAAPAAPTSAPATAPVVEMVDNPQFANWAKFNVGSTSTLTTDIDMGGQKIATEFTNKLFEKAADKVIIEVSGTMIIAGQNQTIPPQKQTILAKIEKQNITEVGAEKVEAAGKTLDTKVYEMVSDNPAQQGGKAKAWISDQVPGGVVKIEAKTPQGAVAGLLKGFEVK